MNARGLPAALRREAHEVECRAAGALDADWYAEDMAYRDDLLARADAAESARPKAVTA